MRFTYKRMFAWMLVAAMLVTNMDYVSATGANTNAYNGDGRELSSAQGSEDGNDGWDNTDTGDGMDFVLNGDANTILFSGELYCGITWKITADGVLYISGEDETRYVVDEKDKETPWLNYKDYFTKAVVDAQCIESTSGWFKDCHQLTEVDFSKADTGSVIDMSDMFRNCVNLKKFDMYDISLFLVRDVSGMFAGCSSLEELDFCCSNCTAMSIAEDMLAGCTSLKKIKAFSYISPSVTVELPMVMYDEEGCRYDTLSHDIPGGKTLYSVLYSGEQHGITWAITKEGTLIIGGEDTSVEVTNATIHPWHAYKDCYSKVIVAAQNVKSTAYWFDGCDNIKEVDLYYLNMDPLGDMRFMFRGCSNLTDLRVGWFKGTNFSSLFEGCSSLAEFDTFHTFEFENVVDASNMFKGCSSLREVDTTHWDTGNVVNMDGMFAGCRDLVELNLEEFNVEKLASATDMLAGCTGLSRVKTVPKLALSIPLPISMYDEEGKVYTELPLGLEAGSWLQAEGRYSGEINGLKWNITTNGTLVLSGRQTLEDRKIPTSYPWHEHKDSFSTVIIMAEDAVSTAYWFDGCDNIVEVKIEEFKADSAIDMRCMFRGCSNLTYLDTIYFNSENVTNFSSMFEGCSKLNEINFNKLSTSGATDLSYMFKDCSGAVSIDVVGFDVRKATTMAGMFKGCSSLDGMSIYYFDTRSLVDMSEMFSGCSSIRYVSDFEQLNTSKVHDMSYLFYGCKKLERVDLGQWDISNVHNMEKMVSGCIGIQTIRMPLNLQCDVELPKDLYNFSGELCTGNFEKGLKISEWLTAEWFGNEGELYITEILPQSYTGKPIKPEFDVYDGTKKLVKNVDYTVSYRNNIKAQDTAKGPAVIVKGKGNYSQKYEKSFDICERDIEDDGVVVEEIVLVYDEDKIQLPVPVITYNGKKLVNEKDFMVSFPEMDDYEGGELPPPYWLPGTYRMVVDGINNFCGWREVYFTITDGTPMKNVKIAAIPKQPFDGENAVEPKVKVTYKGKKLIEGEHYSLSYEDNDKQGKATVIVTGMGDYAGTKKATFQIVGQSIAKAKVTGISDKEYNGQAQTQNPTVELNGNTLEPDKNYVLKYSKNINAGKAVVEIVGIGAYSGTIKKTFKINAYDLKKNSEKLFTGLEENMEVPYAKGGSKPEPELTFAGAKMAVKKDYTISYSNNKKLTTSQETKLPTIKIKGKGNFKGTVSVPFVIVQKNLQDKENAVSITVPDLVCSAQKGKCLSKPVLTDANGKKLKAGVDYEKDILYTLEDGTTKVDANSVLEAGTVVKVSVTGMGGYTGTAQATYRIAKDSFKSAKISIEPKEYTGKEILIKPRHVKVTMGGEELEYGVHYVIVEESHKNNVKKGTASVTIKGVGDYAGSKTVKFKIVPKDVSWFSTWMF